MPVTCVRLTVRIRAVPRSAMIAAAKAAKEIAAEEGTRAGGPLKGKKKRGLETAGPGRHPRRRPGHHLSDTGGVTGRVGVGHLPAPTRTASAAANGDR